ncbi:LCP family glycopolymer transferase [Ignavigranum ruoffiae]|uniref:Cell envelope-related function transcriptional attenuator common domain-containing protein n=1 Tax=Ignavigranum ruoffiae TaxID=89093 RepID=A0A1H9CMT3_9LACT|nr:LCP family protein [Ignavigranum ruoffiae]UPQ86644.1 LCP family protein [Ignavigranum ruoffiae]SEQ02479.1 cell envelope-related function transcriptional attenuator common domain-containing protein [Ignavigranum ruoffiae]
MEESQEITNQEMSGHSPRRKEIHGQKNKLGCLSIGAIGLVIVLGLVVFKLWDMWSSVESTVNKIQMPRAENQIQIRPKPVTVKEDQPFSVLLLGIDTGEYGRVEKGRSDVMLVATVNPSSDKITLTSIPRDSYVEIPGTADKTKINHAYAYGGPGLAANAVQNLLDIPIDYTVAADMKGFKEIIDAVGGITVTPPTTFSQGGFDFQEGVPIKMHGTMALEYIRNRYDSGGDYGRQDRARQVVLGIIRSGLELDTLINYQNILNSISNNVKTDISYEEMMHIASNYRSAINHVEEFQLKGQGEKIDGVYYEILDPSAVQEVSRSIQAELDIE